MESSDKDFFLQKKKTAELILASKRYHASFGRLGGPTGFDFESAEVLTNKKINKLSQNTFKKVRKTIGLETWFFEKSILRDLKTINSNEYVTFQQPFSGEDIITMKAGAIFLFRSEKVEKYYEERLRRLPGIVIHNEIGRVPTERIDALSVFANTLKAPDFWQSITSVLGVPLKRYISSKRAKPAKVFSYMKKLNYKQIKASELYHSYFGSKGGPAGLKGASILNVMDKHINKFSKATNRIVKETILKKSVPLDKSIIEYLAAINKNPDTTTVGSCSGDHSGQYITRDAVEPWVMLAFKTKQAENRYEGKLLKLRGIKVERVDDFLYWAPGTRVNKNVPNLEVTAKSEKEPLRFWDKITSVLTKD